MSRRQSGPLVWALGTLAWVVGIVAVRPLVGSDPLVVAAQTVIDRSPGGLATWAIETFGKDAQPALVFGLAVAVVCAGAALGALVRWADPPRRYRLWLPYAVAAVVLGVTAAGFHAAAGGLSLRWLLATVLSVLPPAVVSAARPRGERPVGRRGALRGIGGAVGTVAVGGAVARAFRARGWGSGPAPGEPLDPVTEKTQTGTTTPASAPATPPADRGDVESRQKTEGVVVSVADTDADFGFDFAGMPARVGSADDHYVVDKAVSTPHLPTDDWTLTVDGFVADRREYAFEELLDHPEAREMTLTMVCISNTVGGNLISTTDWRVVPVRALLEEAFVRPAAVDVVTRAADGYTEALPWSVVKERDDVVIAVGMDGGTLPAKHGFPARLLVPGRYGMKSTKWVTGIEVVPRDHAAYWEKRGWDEEAVINTLSYVRAVQRRGDRVAVGGVAYAGVRGIDRVEVSVDGGDTWADATLEAPPADLTWRRWRRVVERSDSGPLDVVVRATDGEGTRQTRERTGPHPGGSTGWHSVTVSL